MLPPPVQRPPRPAVAAAAGEIVAAAVAG